MVTFDFVKSPITKIVDAIIIEASKSGASDIHFDPREDGLMVRRRIDGDLVDYTIIPSVYVRNLITRLKLMAGMNITESRLPQDGAIKGKFGEKDLDMRVSCLPTNEGEKIVVRILDYTRSLNGIEKLGFNEENFQKLQNMIAAPNGIILITGATGSGKSTTSYSILQVLNKEKTNIITVEDPIEMNIEGLNQVQVNSEIGLDFATVLRSILRQDPNVILIGEIRDSETAKIAVRASITGHLVLSTLHTNNSLATIERLLDMDVERYLLSTALTGIISQRLAKTVCPHCHIERETTPYEKKVFKLALRKDVDKIIDANPIGCKECNKGYRGRIAIQEVLEINDDIRNALNDEKVEKEDIRKLVYGSGNVITLLQDGLQKILNGSTTFEEIYRIIEIDNDITDSYYEEFNEGLDKKEKIELEKERNKEIAELRKIDNVPISKTNSGEIKSILSNNIELKKEENILPTLDNNNLVSPLLQVPTTNSDEKSIVPTDFKPINEDTNEKTESPTSIPDVEMQNTVVQLPKVNENETSVQPEYEIKIDSEGSSDSIENKTELPTVPLNPNLNLNDNSNDKE